MSYLHAIAAHDLLDSPTVTGEDVVAWWRTFGLADATITPVANEQGATDSIRLLIPGLNGKSGGGDAPTLGIIGRLGGVGARPEAIGFVSDGDGALAAVAAGAKLISMSERGDRLAGDVIIATHIDPDAPVIPHDPVAFMGSAIDMATMNELEVRPEMDAIISIDTTKGNRIVNHVGIAVTPTVKDGWVLRVSEDVLDVYERSTGFAPVVLPITTQDITPYSNNAFHVNSILQPATATSAPVIGLAITSEAVLPGSGTGCTDLPSVVKAIRFVIEAAKGFGAGSFSLYDEPEFADLVRRYGSLSHLRH